MVRCQAEGCGLRLIDYRDAKPREPIPTRYLMAARVNLPDRRAVIHCPHDIKVTYIPPNIASGLRMGPRGGAIVGSTLPRTVAMAPLGSRIK